MGPDTRGSANLLKGVIAMIKMYPVVKEYVDRSEGETVVSLHGSIANACITAIHLNEDSSSAVRYYVDTDPLSVSVSRYVKE